MENKIFEEIKEKELNSYAEYLKLFDIIKNENELTGSQPKRNIDLGLILSKFGLVELNTEITEQIDEFHDYLFKLGIEIGVGQGKKWIIDSIKSDEITLDKIKKIDPEKFVDFQMEPSFIYDMRAD